MAKKIFSIAFALVFTFCFAFFGACNQPTTPPPTTPPLPDMLDARAIQNSGARANCVWDMQVFNNKLYIGTGDYSANSGETSIWAYDFSTEKWIEEWVAPTNAIARFKQFGNSLVALGTDPLGDWELGEYYSLTNGEWQQFRVIPNGIHNFDMAIFDGKIFAGLGVEKTNTPIVVSTDGQNFNGVTLTKNGQALDFAQEEPRVYDFIEFGGSLYAVAVIGENSSVEVYKYNGISFDFFADWTSQLTFAQLGENLLNGKVVFNDSIYFTSGVLYKTTDLTTLSTESEISGGAVSDILVVNNKLVVLRVQKNTSGGYVNTLWISDGDTFTELHTFEFSVPAICMEYYGGTFFLGMGDKLNANAFNGSIVKVAYPNND